MDRVAMRLFVVYIFAAMIGLGFIASHTASADVWIPDNEFKGFYNVNGTYTVIGAVKNSENKSIVPTVTVNIKDDDRAISEKYTLETVSPQKDIPFKIEIPEVKGKEAVLDKPQVSYFVTSHNNPDVEVVYDKTLKKYADGHETGMLVNKGESTAYGIRVYAVIYGKDDKILDVGKNIEEIPKIDPGEKVSFSMYPDPQHASMVKYYSCFTVSDNPNFQVSFVIDGSPYNFTYLTTGSITDFKYDDSTHSITATARYPFPDTGFVNFMFPEESSSEKFSITSNGKPVQFIQSRDPDGYWHVALSLPSRSTSHLAITGFGPTRSVPEFSLNDDRSFLLVAIPVTAAAISIVIWKKRTK